MPYRSELKRPDLKGSFPCTVCGKVFCHSSSLSRHRMQAHFKSYTCTQCNQEISSNETLRSHMFRIHSISRMFMCRCCNWAYPDKTSLHIHMQSMLRNGTPGEVSVLARSTNDAPGMAGVVGEMSPHELERSSSGSPVDKPESISPPINDLTVVKNSLFTNTLLNGSIFPATLNNSENILSRFASKPPDNIFSQTTDANGQNNWLAWLTNSAFSASYNINNATGNLFTGGTNSSNVGFMVSDDNDVTATKTTATTTTATTATITTTTTATSTTTSTTTTSFVEKTTRKVDGQNGILTEHADDGNSPKCVDNNVPQTLCCPVQENGSCTLNQLLGKNNQLTPRNHRNKRKASNPQQLRSSPSGFFVGDDVDQDFAKVSKKPLTMGSKIKPEISMEMNPNELQVTPSASEYKSNPTDQHTTDNIKDAAKCTECSMLKAKYGIMETRNRFLESKIMNHETKIDRVDVQLSGIETTLRQYEQEHEDLRHHIDTFSELLLGCQQSALAVLALIQTGGADSIPAVKKIMENLLESTKLSPLNGKCA